MPTYNYGDRRRPNPPYMALLNAARRKRIAGEREEARKLRQQAQQMPARDPNDPDFRRLWYVRYADDWLFGFSGPRFGGIELRRQKAAVINDRPPEVFNNLRSEIVQRLLADQCELCGAEDNCEVHHIRKLADLNRPGQKEKPEWVKRMAARRRKTLVVRQKCHEEIHRERSSGREPTARITGEPT